MDETATFVTPRIVFILPSFAGGGAERVLLTLLSGLDRARYTPELVVVNGVGPLVKAVPADVTVHDLQRMRLRHALPQLLSVLRRLRPDIVLSTLGYLNLAVLALRPLLHKKPRILIREANTPSRSLPATPWPGAFRLGYRLLYPTADGVICQSQLMMAEMGRDFMIPQERLHHLANPVDVAAIRRRASVGRRVPGEGLRFVAAGRLTRQKGFDRLLEMLVKAPPDTHLTIFGEGPELSALTGLAGRLGVESRVRFAGFDPMPWPAYAGADAFLLPSRWEGMPNAVLEALACGTPVIATPESGGIREVAAGVEPGAVILAEAGEAFAAAMRAVVPQARTILRASLLPKRFDSDSVQAAFQAILSGEPPACAPPAGIR